MSMDRRKFLKIAGISVLGFSIKPAANLFAGREVDVRIHPNPKALRAKRWGMAIDLRRMNERIAKKCVEACHRFHNVPHIPDKKREIKWIWIESFEHAFPEQAHERLDESLKEKPVLVFCNHCEHPPCVRVCPTQATFKREDGIVMMDMHRCIGCRFCMAACPYGSRSFNWMDPRPYIKKEEENSKYPTREKGVVEKCDFCAERLDKGLPPLCVEVSEGALIFGDLEDPNSEINKVLRERYNICRKPSLGTGPSIYYLL